jgi:Leucine-rich repeat (LRR) protein
VLDKNQLTEIPKSIYQLKNLKTLSLNGNKLTEISDFISTLKTLEVLDLRNNYLKRYDIEVIKALLPKCNVIF